MKFDAAIKEDRAEVRRANKEDRYGFHLKLSIGHILTAFRPVQSLASSFFQTCLINFIMQEVMQDPLYISPELHLKHAGIKEHQTLRLNSSKCIVLLPLYENSHV